MLQQCDVLGLYEQNLFLQAYRQATEDWAGIREFSELSPFQLVTGGRLAYQTGSFRLSRWLFWLAHRKAPADPLVRCFSPYRERRERDLYSLLMDYERDPDLDTDDQDLLSSWHANLAESYSEIRDFARAAACLEKARSFDSGDPWIDRCDAWVKLNADRWQEALEAAETCWEKVPGKPYAAFTLGQCLLKLGRVEEAVERLVPSAEGGESFLLAGYGIWLLCTLAGRQEGSGKANTLDRAQKLADRMGDLAPRPDRETLLSIAQNQLDIADLKEDRDAACHWAEQIGSHYHRIILANIRSNPMGECLRLPVRRVRQKFETCLPSSIASVLAGLDISVDEEEIASQLTFGGTSIWRASEWLEERGLAVRHFPFTPETSLVLLRAGFPFVLNQQSEGGGHSVAVFGFDEAAGILLIHDPSLPREVECLLSGMGWDERPVGPGGMVIVPAERLAEVERILPQEGHRVMAALHAHRKALETEGIPAARRVLEPVVREYPDHPIVRYRLLVQLVEEGHVREAAAGYEELLSAHPDCLLFRHGLLTTYRALGNQALLRETLAGLVENGRLPGVQRHQEWWYPPDTYVCQYADILRSSAALRPKARNLLRRLVGRQPQNAEAWHCLADTLWGDSPSGETLLAYRAASCVALNNEHYARVYCDALGENGQREEGLAWLIGRVETLGAGPQATGPWITLIDALEDYGCPEEALSRLQMAQPIHGHSPDLMAFAVGFLSRMGKWEEAAGTLESLRVSGFSARYLEAAVHYHTVRNEWAEALPLARRWVEECPRSPMARDRLLDLIAQGEGDEAALGLASSWVEAQPGHDELEDLYYSWLKRCGRKEEQERLLESRVERNPEDGWAWRERTFLKIGEYSRTAPDKEDEAFDAAMEVLLAQCHRTGPQEIPTLRIRAFWCRVRGQWEEARSLWKRILEMEPDVAANYSWAWGCFMSSPEIREEWLQWVEELQNRCMGRMKHARELALLVARNDCFARSDGFLERLREKQPDDPDLLEASVDLWLNFGKLADVGRALAVLETAVERFPHHAGLRVSLADAYAHLKRDGDSEATWNEILRLHPGHIPARLQLSIIRKRRGDLEGALRWLNEAVAMFPMDEDILGRKADLLLGMGRKEEAVSLVLELVGRMPRQISSRERAVDFLLKAEEEAKAMEMAREATRIAPENAVSWAILARVLRQCPALTDAAETEQVLQKARTLDPLEYGVTDELAMLLAEQDRFQEALDLLEETAGNMTDPSPARGRMAWVLLCSGEKDKAFALMEETVRTYPWYRWGWDQLLQWWSQEERWAEARAMLIPSPECWRNDLEASLKRLQVLLPAGMPSQELEAEWETLIGEYPHEMPLRLEYYDLLIDQNQAEKAAGILDEALRIDPENPYSLARRMVSLVKKRRWKDSFEVGLGIWFAGEEESSWPATEIWKALIPHFMQPAFYQAACEKMKAGMQPSMTALRLMADFARKRETKVYSRRSWLDNFYGGWELKKLLRLLDRTPWVEGRHRAVVLDELQGIGFQHWVLRYWRKNPDRVEKDAYAWSVVGQSMLAVRRKKARAFLGAWREHPGVGMEAVVNHILSIRCNMSSDYREVQASCRDALRDLPHDENARFLAHVLAEACLCLRDLESFREAWKSYGKYYDGRLGKGEYFHPKRVRLLADIPYMGHLLESGLAVMFNKLLGPFSLGNAVAPKASVTSWKPDVTLHIPWGALVFLALLLLRGCAS